MSGSGRKSGYRKTVATDYLDELPEPKENERIVQVTYMHGNNKIEVQGPGDDKPLMAMLPNRFHKMIREGSDHMPRWPLVLPLDKHRQKIDCRAPSQVRNDQVTS